MHALRRHQVATFTKELTREFKIVMAETTVSVFIQNQVASDTNEPTQEKLFMKKNIQRTHQWNLPWLNTGKKHVNIYSCWICPEELGRYDLLLKHYDNHMMLSDTTEI